MHCSCSLHTHVKRRGRTDPTMTKSLREKFEREMMRRFRWLAREIERVVVEEDGFNLEGRATPIISPVVNRDGRFEFVRPEEKVSSFLQWLDVKTHEGILRVQIGTPIDKASREAWTNLYIDTAYQRGIRQAGAKMRAGGVTIDPEWLDAAFHRPLHAERAALIHTRAFEGLENINQAMSDQIADRLTIGIIEGKGPMEIARDLNSRVASIGLTRARILARTEIISAHAESSLTSYEEAGIHGVDVEAEWLTAGDGLVCPECDGLAAAGPYSIEEARGLIPAHPNCRCTFAPRVVLPGK